MKMYFYRDIGYSGHVAHLMIVANSKQEAKRIGFRIIDNELPDTFDKTVLKVTFNNTHPVIEHLPGGYIIIEE